VYACIYTHSRLLFRTQGFALAKQVLYPWAMPPVHFALVILEIGSQQLLAQTGLKLLSSWSHLARILRHESTVPSFYFNCTKEFHCDISILANNALWANSPPLLLLSPSLLNNLKGFHHYILHYFIVFIYSLFPYGDYFKKTFTFGRGRTGVWTQDFTLTKQVLYGLSHTSSPFCSGYFEMGSYMKYLPGLASNHYPPNLSPLK
jgi:hypothetical protein